jgi:hypothetical protein
VWQASNTDEYFAVTTHWIKAPISTEWELSSALIGFTHVNNVHVGVHLGQALFKIVKRMGIENKVCCSPHTCMCCHTHRACLKGWPCTCDNASNNGTMMREFAARLKVATGKNYDWKQRKIK